MIARPTSPHHPKILLIGASGLVGMATRDAITQYLGADVITWDRPITSETQQAARAEREEYYKMFGAAQYHSIDGKQAKWLLTGYHPLPANKHGQVSTQNDINEALNEDPDCIVITAGAPRKGDETRKMLIGKNAPFFSEKGKEIADFIIRKIEANPNYSFPPLICVGNPMDTMVEVLGRIIYERLISHAKEVLGKSQNLYLEDGDRQRMQEIHEGLLRESRSLRSKIIGQGGVLDGARAANAIETATKNSAHPIALGNIVSAPVISSHNENMISDLESTKVKYDGKKMSLSEYPGFDLEANKDTILKLTKAGGKAVMDEYTKMTEGKLEQTAIFATSAATMQMVDSIINNKQKLLPAAVYHLSNYGDTFSEKTPKGVMREKLVGKAAVMGQMVKLGRDGVTEMFVPEQGFRDSLKEAREKARVDTIMGLNTGSAL